MTAIRPWATLAVLICVAWIPGIAAAQESDDSSEPAYSRGGADNCLRCHDEDSAFPVLAIFKTPHGSKDDLAAPFGQLQCESCHGPGGAHAGRVRRGQERPGMLNFGALEETPIEEQNAVCSGCHDKALGVNWHGSAHEADDLACADCHQVHVSRDPVLSEVHQPEVCYTCHQEQRAQSFKASAHPVRFGKMACSACHSPHGSEAEFSLNRGNLNETCYGCHAEKRGPFLWEHAPATEDCSLCHNAHGSNHPALLTRRAPRLCQQCHSQDGHPSIAHTPAGLSSPGGSSFLLGGSCTNCHTQPHGSNHPSGAGLTR